MRGIAFLTLMLAVAVGAPAAEPPLQAGFTAALKTFGEMRENLATVIAPADRAPEATALTKLSASLDSLVQAKRQLTENLVNAQWPQGKRRTLASAQAFKDAIRKTRFALTDVFAPLSSDWQTRGGDILTRLDSGFHEQWQSLDDAARDLGLPGATPEQFRAESDQFIASTQQLKQLVDGIVADLAK